MQAGESAEALPTSVSSMAKRMNAAWHITVRALISWDVAAGLGLVTWVFSLSYVQGFHLSVVGTDAILQYFPAAQKLLEGQGYHAFAADVNRGPGYPLMLAVIANLLQFDLFTASKVIAVTFSVLFLLFAYLVLRRVFEPRTALAAMLLTMALNSFAFVSCMEGTDLPFAALAMASLYFVARRDGPTGSDAILSGLLGGLALATRWTGLFLPLLILVGMGLVPRREFGLRSRIQRVGLYMLAFLVTSGPWLYTNYLLHGNPLYNENLNPSVLDLELFPSSTIGLGSMLQVVQQEPLSFGLEFIGKFFGSFPSVIQGLNGYPSPKG
ncbi:MAG: glycosyltransferase family 39 protein [Chloroflexi bacterium]|nr:glycosyltransferase family 39 protein [Chloroflexota bacterium]